MPRSPRSFNPLDPAGQRLNTLLGTDLRDPTSFLEQLAARKAAAPAPVQTVKPKQAQPEQPAKPATSTTTTGQDPRSGGPAPTPRPAAPAAPSDSMTAARASYESELAAFAERERMGLPVDPLTRKRALQRYENNLGRIKAIQAQEGRKTAFWDQVRGKKAKREAANARANQMAGEALASSTAALEQSMQTAQPVKSIDELNAEYTRKLGQDYAAQQAAAAAKVTAAGQDLATRISGGADWLTKAIDRSVSTLQEAARKTPTGQISEIAGPPSELMYTPEQRRIMNALSQVGQFDRDLRRTPGTINYSREDFGPGHLLAQSEADQAAVDKAARDTFSRLSTGQTPPADRNDMVNRELDAIRAGQPSPFGAPGPSIVNPLAGMTPKMDPMALRASQVVSDRYKAMGVDPMDPNVTSRYMQDVDRELRNMTPTGQVGAPMQLPAGTPPSWTETAINTLAGPGGLIGAPLPPELAQREIAMAPTEAARSVAQGREAMGAMQEPFWTLAGGGLVPTMKGETYSPALPQRGTPQPSAEMRRVVGRTTPTTAPTRPVQINQGWETPYSPRQSVPSPGGAGGFFTPEAPVSMTPGRQGVEIGPVPQPRPYVPGPETGMDAGVLPGSNPKLQASRSEIRQHMVENPDAGQGIGVARRRNTPVQELAPLDFPAPTPGRVGGPGAARVQAPSEQGLLPFAERATNPSSAKNPNVTGQFKIDESGPSFQKIVDPESGVNGAFTVIKPEGPFQEDRLVVFANVNGETIPFYRSQGGTSGKQQGSFYPFPGISAEDWLVKGTSQDKSGWANYNEYYNNPGFRKVAEYLNSKYGRESLQEARSLLERDFGKPVEGPDGANQNIPSYALINKAAGNRAVNVVNAMKDVQGPADPRVMPELLKWNLRTFPEQYWQGVPWANTPDPVSNLAEIPGQMTLPGFER